MTTMIRAFEAARINEIINDPNVHPFIAERGTGPLDMAPLLEDRRNVLLMEERQRGGILFHWLDGGLYEAHTSFLPQARGPTALNFARDAISWMMTHTDCIELVTKVPVFNGAAVAFAVAAGMISDFERPDAWNGPDGVCYVRYYSLSYQGWMAHAPGNGECGSSLHKILERAGSHVDHGIDLAHECHVGASILTAQAGQLDKAVVFYNRWARRAGYAPVRIVAKDPPIIDIGNALILIGQGDVEVLKCQK
jgi:hypothetical protein